MTRTELRPPVEGAYAYRQGRLHGHDDKRARTEKKVRQVSERERVSYMLSKRVKERQLEGSGYAPTDLDIVEDLLL